MSRFTQEIELITSCRHDWVKTYEKELHLQFSNKKYKCSKCEITKEHSHAFVSDREEVSYTSITYESITKIRVWPPVDRYTEKYYNTKYKNSKEVIETFEKEGILRLEKYDNL